MTSERAKAYGRLIRMLAEAQRGNVQSAEVDVVREAADTVLFAEDASAVAPVLDETSGFLGHLVEEHRIEEEAGQALMRELTACGPLAHVGR